jgi:type VI secretion system protein VasD
MSSRARVVACLAWALLALTACASGPPKPAVAKAQLSASADVNPDSSGRPSPVVVRVFQLRGDAEFTGAGFFALYDKEKETLGASLISREEYVLQPGEQKMLELPLSREASFIGAIAAYRDIQTARWRAITVKPEKTLTDMLKKDRVTITVAKSAITLTTKD